MSDLRSAPVPDLRADDHAQGSGPLVIFYGDLACPRCALAWERLRGQPLSVCFRHFALRAKGPRTVQLAHAAEAAARQGGFWRFIDAMYADQGRVEDPHLWEHCEREGLDVQRFEVERRGPEVAARVDRDVQDGLRAGVTVTPTLFVCAGGVWTAHPGPPDASLVREWTQSDLTEKN